jgi:hypothetical protein
MVMSSYRKHVRDLAELRDGTPVFNGSTEHASVIAECMFAKANNCVRILNGKMNARVYASEGVREQISLFLADDSHKLQILIEDFSENNLTDHPFFDGFLDHQNVVVRGLLPELAADIKFHFLVMDDDSYRFERNKEKHEAVAAFGEAKGARNLIGVFEELWDACASNEIDPTTKKPRLNN